jgi:hypothetical protein
MLRLVALVRTDVSEENLVFLCSVRRLLVTASVVPSSPILVTLMMEALSSSETSVLTRATWRNIPEDAILHYKTFLRKYELMFVTQLQTWQNLDATPDKFNVDRISVTNYLKKANTSPTTHLQLHAITFSLISKMLATSYNTARFTNTF